jgi:hypothetical protein
MISRMQAEEQLVPTPSDSMKESWTMWWSLMIMDLCQRTDRPSQLRKILYQAWKLCPIFLKTEAKEHMEECSLAIWKNLPDDVQSYYFMQDRYRDIADVEMKAAALTVWFLNAVSEQWDYSNESQTWRLTRVDERTLDW